MTSRPAQYLLRFDDLCPTHFHNRWQRWEDLIAEFDIKPILAIVPDNRDDRLFCSPPDPRFWNRMRALEATGAAIGLHGFRHLCMSHGRSLVPLHAESEFAGVPEVIQRQWIGEALEVLRGHGLSPNLWVAPQHGLDHATLRALREHRISFVSDGFARRPFRLGGLTWIPQQLWAPVPKSHGVWTICLHPNTAADDDLAAVRAFLEKHRRQFTSIERAAAEWPLTRLNFTEQCLAAASVYRFRVRKAAKHLAHGL